MRLQTHYGLFEGRWRSFRQRVRIPLQAQTSRHHHGRDAGRVGVILRLDALPMNSIHPSFYNYFYHRHHYGGVNHYTNIPVCQIYQSSILFYLFILDLRERNFLIGFLLMIFQFIYIQFIYLIMNIKNRE